jgi:hypothetical protein
LKDYIYLIECDNGYEKKYKIGFSKHPEQRLLELKTGNPEIIEIKKLFITKHNRRVEMALHNRYALIRTNGEWFYLEQKDVNEFMDLCNKYENNFDILKKYENPFF